MQKITASITGVAAYVPDYILTNEELEQTVETTNEWIVTRCGVSERRILKDKDKASAYMAAEAAQILFFAKSFF